MRYEEAATIARRRIYGGKRGFLTRRATRRALRLAPKDHRTLWLKFLDAQKRGHRIKVGNYPARLIYPPSDEFVKDVESAFEGVDEG